MGDRARRELRRADPLQLTRHPRALRRAEWFTAGGNFTYGDSAFAFEGVLGDDAFVLKYRIDQD
jgi:hypothetical protein